MRIPVLARRAARRSIGLLIAMLLLTLPAVVLANHQFPDVLNSNPFHDDIDAIAEAGITAGFNDGGYHPSEAVTRQAMAAFMHRGFGRVGMEIGDSITDGLVALPGNATSNDLAVRELTITVPGATNAFNPSQFVHLSGRVVFQTSMDAPQGCPCEFGAYIRDDNDSTFSLVQYQVFESSTAQQLRFTLDVEALFTAPPGDRRYELRAFLNFRSNTSFPAAYYFHPNTSLSAMTFPFGPTGENTP